MTAMTLKTINKYLQTEILDAKKLDTAGDVDKEIAKKRMIGYLCSVAIQGRKADIEERLEILEKKFEEKEQGG
jgi:hypothetical protein